MRPNEGVRRGQLDAGQGAHRLEAEVFGHFGTAQEPRYFTFVLGHAADNTAYGCC